MVMLPPDAENALCSCAESAPCASCRFCMAHNTTSGRKALCEKITRFLVTQPTYQNALARTMLEFFPKKTIHDDEKDICRMIFEAILFEDATAGTTPLSTFLQRAALSADEQRLYAAWREHTRYGFFVVEKIIVGQEIHASDAFGERRYRIYEHAGTARIKEGEIIVARLVPFAQGWMISTETVLTYQDTPSVRERLRASYGPGIAQFPFVRRYHREHKRRMSS
jgi:hypothetical protein